MIKLILDLGDGVTIERQVAEGKTDKEQVAYILFSGIAIARQYQDYLEETEDDNNHRIREDGNVGSV